MIEASGAVDGSRVDSLTARTAHPTPDVLNVGFRNRLGESPWWDGTALSWVDIFGLRVHRALLDGSDASGFATPGQPGFAIPDADGFVVGLPGFSGTGLAVPVARGVRAGPGFRGFQRIPEK